MHRDSLFVPLSQRPQKPIASVNPSILYIGSQGFILIRMYVRL
jgi:hypothetical protein